MAIQAYTGNFGAKEITHLLKRCLFGVKRSEITANLGKTLTEVVDILLLDVAPPTHQLIIITIIIIPIPKYQQA